MGDVLLVKLTRPHQVTRQSYRRYSGFRTYNFRRGPLGLYGCWCDPEDAKEFLAERSNPGAATVGSLVHAFRLANVAEAAAWEGH